MTRRAIIIGCLLAGLAVCATAFARKPLVPPEIVDMKIVGAMGSVYNDIANNLLLNGSYLYCAMTQNAGLKTLNVSDPANMYLTSEWVGSTDGSGQTHGLARKGTSLYMTNWYWGTGLRVFSLADPAHPSLTRTITTTESSWSITADGNLLFVTISNGYDLAGIDIFDITTASNPVFLTFLQAPQRSPGQVARSGNYMYMPVRNWLDVYNITNPSSPTFVRRLTFNASTGGAPTRVSGGYLYMAAGDNDSNGWTDGGLFVFSLTDPSNPQQISYFDWAMFKDFHMQGNLGIVPTGGNGVLAVDMTNIFQMSGLWQEGMEWPGTGPGGYEDAATGAGDYAFIGTDTPGGCTQDCGGRVYAVRVLVPSPPIIKEVTPDPDSAYAGQSYREQLKLLDGVPLPTWSVVQGPPGTEVDANGLVTGWTPSVSDLGSTQTICIHAVNSDGFDDECWQVKVWSIADFDRDDDVDQGDFGVFQQCLSGADSYPTGCQNADFNGDGHVEEADMTLFMTCIGGPGLPPGC